MDTITHGIVGALCGKAFFAGKDTPAATSSIQVAASSLTARAGIAACTLGAIFPDIDVFAGPLARNPLATIEWHRSITHSIVMLPVWALLLAALAVPLARWARWKAPSYAALVGLFAFGIATHIFLDVITNFGTMIWSPLNDTRVAWDWIFIVDLTFSGIALVPQLAAWCYREPPKFAWRAIGVWLAITTGAGFVYVAARSLGYGFSPWVIVTVGAIVAAMLFVPALGRQKPGFRWTRARWCRAGVALACFYLAGTALHHHLALGYTREFAAANHLDAQALAALPLPPTFTQWAGIIETPEGIRRITFRVPGYRQESSVFYSDPPPDRYLAEARELRGVQIYLWFARFPVWQIERQGSDTAVEITDARFFRDTNQGTDQGEETQQDQASARPPTGPGFTFEAVFDSQGRLVYQGLKPPQP